MLPFTIKLRSGEPIFDQVVYAVTRAILTGQLRPGDPFPSVRVISHELKINPNTAHKIVAELTAQGLLAVRPGVGTVIASGKPGDAAARRALLDEQTERLVIEATRSGVLLPDLLAAIRRHWSTITAFPGRALRSRSS